MSRAHSFLSRISDNVEDLVPIEFCNGADRRRTPRLIELHPCAVQSAIRLTAATIVNLSTTGAALRWAGSDLPKINETLIIKLIGNTDIEAHVVRVHERSVAVQFSHKLKSLDDVLMNDHLGRDFFCEALRLQKLSQ